ELGPGLVGPEVGMHELGPGARRARHRGPVRGALVDDHARLADGRQLVAADAARVEVAEQPRMRRAGQADASGALAAELEDPLAEPGRHEVQRVVGGVLDARLLYVQVEV